MLSMLSIKALNGTSLAIQWLRLCASTAGGTGLIPGQGTKIPYATQYGKKKKKTLNILIIDFKNSWSDNSNILAIPDSGSDACSVSSKCGFCFSVWLIGFFLFLFLSLDSQT